MSDVAAKALLESEVSATHAADAVYSKIMWRLMPFLVLCYVLAFIDRSNIGFAKLEFMRDLGFDDAVYGMGAGIFYLGYILLEVPSNLYLAIVGVRLTLLRIMVVWGLCSAALAFMASPAYFYVFRFLLGAAEAGLFPGILLYLTYWIPATRRARFTAIFMMSIAIAGMLGGPLAGVVMQSADGWLELKGWQWLFLVEGLPAAVLGVVAYFYLSDGPADCRWLSHEQKALVLTDLRRERVEQQAKTHHSFSQAARSLNLYALVVMAFALLVGTGAIFIWLPSIIRRSGVASTLHIGLLSALPFLAAFVAQFLVARHSDRTQERRWHVIVPAVIAGVSWILLPMVSQHIGLSLLLMTLVTMGTLSATGPFWTMPSALLSGAATAGGIALITTIAGFGSFISPVLVGWMAARTGSLAFGQYYFGALMLLGAVVLLLGSPPNKSALILATG